MKQSMGEFLATLRRANGYTQQEVAEKLGVSNRTLSSWETDRTAPDLLILPAIADLYGVTADEILRGERKAAEESAAVISDGAKKNLRKRQFAKFGTRRLFCLGFALLGSLIFLAGCAVLLYSSAPLWLSVLLMVIGAGGCVACVILTACFAYSAIKAEGLVLKEDYTEENMPYALCVHRGVANSLFWLSLPHILGAIVLLIVFFAAGYYDYNVELVWVSVEIDYMTPTVTLVCLNAAFALAFFVSGLVLNLSGVFGFGSEWQRAAVKSNGKLLGKIAGFGAIPVGIALIALVVCACITPISKIKKVYFEAQTVQEVYENFQTYETDEWSLMEDDGTSAVIVPAGKYFLNFQSEDYITLGMDKIWGDPPTIRNFDKFYDLGNGFYGKEYWVGGGYAVYHLLPGIKAEDIVDKGYYWDYLTGLEIRSCEETIWIPETENELAVNAAGFPCGDVVVESDVVGLYIWGNYQLEYSGGVYSYVEIWYYNCTELVAVIFWAVVGGAVIADTIAYFIKRKRTEYSF